MLDCRPELSSIAHGVHERASVGGDTVGKLTAGTTIHILEVALWGFRFEV